MNMTNIEISRLVRQKLQYKGMTLIECCNAFNARYQAEIKTGSTKRLNKDFLSRVVRNDFKVCTERISKLCEFLGVRTAHSTKGQLQILSDQICELRRQSDRDAEFRNQFFAVEKFLSGLNLKKMLDEY